MEHLAIMKKSWGLTQKIISGRKTIESRWYKNRYAPWGKIKTGEIIYFKNSGEAVTIKATVNKVIEFSDLNPLTVQDILDKYGEDDGIEEDQIEKYFQLFKEKKYCLLIYLKNPQKIVPFDIDKTGYGSMSAWITVDSVKHLQKK